MYATCIFCHHHLGHNEVVEAFPVGRRLAFGARKGRLWVVCRRCERWNLTPLEERWEAIEECERQFRGARLRVTSANIGMAKLKEGLELVRIGEPLRPEFVTWRYGRTWRRRRRRAVVVGGAAVAVAGAGIALGAGPILSTLGPATVFWAPEVLKDLGKALLRASQLRRGVTIPLDGKRLVKLGPLDLQEVRLVRDRSYPEGWYLNLRGGMADTRLTGHEGMRALALVMPRFNVAGASARLIRHALEQLEMFHASSDFLRSAAAEGWYFAPRDDLGNRRGPPPPRRGGDGDLPGPLIDLTAPTRLAIEVAVNEEHERMALEGELASLELAWQEAEAVAAIADNLILPRRIEQALRKLRGEGSRPPPDR